MQVEIAKLERDCPYSLFAGDRVKEVVTTYCLVLAVEEHSQMIYFPATWKGEKDQPKIFVGGLCLQQVAG